jgi:hypothetical protein
VQCVVRDGGKKPAKPPAGRLGCCLGEQYGELLSLRVGLASAVVAEYAVERASHPLDPVGGGRLLVGQRDVFGQSADLVDTRGEEFVDRRGRRDARQVGGHATHHRRARAGGAPEFRARLPQRLSGHPEPLLVRGDLRPHLLGDGFDAISDQVRDLATLTRSSPALSAWTLQIYVGYEAAIAELVAPRLPDPAPDDVRPRLSGAMAMASVRIALDDWLRHGGSLPQRVRTALAALSVG